MIVQFSLRVTAQWIDYGTLSLLIAPKHCNTVDYFEKLNTCSWGKIYVVYIFPAREVIFYNYNTGRGMILRTVCWVERCPIVTSSALDSVVRDGLVYLFINADAAFERTLH